MKPYILSTLPSLLLLPVSALAATTGSLDFWTLGVFLTANFLITAGLFGLGILLIGLFYDRFKPWLLKRREQRRARQRKFPHPPHVKPLSK
jgi:membrane protein DedA with SNARE-associated domain